MNYQTLRNVPVDWSLIAFSFLVIVVRIRSLNTVDQLSLEMEPTLKEFDHYLENYIGDNQKLALLLDYDGTLAKIAPHPNMTRMTEATQSKLIRLAKNPNIFTAVISGRGVGDVKNKVDIEGIIYAGNHGLEILYPNGTKYNHKIPGEISEKFEKLIDALQVVARDGAWIENKQVSLTFHYRALPEDQHESIRDEASEIISKFGYRPNLAHCAIEAKPPVQWNKGKAAEYILNHNFGDNWRDEVKIIFAGDDTTDEDVFELLTGSGVTFRITKDLNMVSKATYKIPSTDSVTTLLEWVEKKFK